MLPILVTARMYKKITDNNLVNVQASLVLLTNFILLGILMSNYEEIQRFIQNSVAERSNMNFKMVIVLFLSISTLCSLKIIFAFLGSGNIAANHYSLIFFGSIADMKLDEYIERGNNMNEEKYIRDLHIQIHRLSKELGSKYRYFNISCICLLIAILTIILGTWKIL